MGDEIGSSGTGRRSSVRLHYLDWLRVIATLGVFLFHVSNVFNTVQFEIKNDVGSELITVIQAFFWPWGMPVFFFVAGAGSWFALRRRSAAQFTRERTLRLLVPFLTGTILLGPIQLYLSWHQRKETGLFDGSLLAFTAARLSRIGPKLFGALGYHMWFLGFLFAYSLLALPLFVWLGGPSGRKLVSRLAGFCERRGAILVLALPVVAVRLGLQPFFPVQQDWADFVSHGTFFILGFLVFSDDRFTQAVWRDWWILLGVGALAIAVAMVIGTSLEVFDIERAPRTVSEFALWGLVAICGWCWTALTLSLGMRFLDRDGPTLRYALGAILPFFVVHQPVILAVATVVVRWETTILVKLLAVGLGSFVISIGIYEWIIKRVKVLRLIFGIKPAQPVQLRAATI